MMDDQEKIIGPRLIKLIFGKMASQKYLTLGINNVLYEEKLYLTNFVSEHLKNSDLKNKNEISIFREHKICEDFSMDTKNSMLDSVQKSISNEENSQKGLKIYISLKTYADELKLNKSKIHFKILNNSKLISTLLQSKVPQKYMEHLIWLICYSQSQKKVQSFKNLLKEVYIPDIKQKPRLRKLKKLKYRD
jgi:hypothetical protein